MTTSLHAAGRWAARALRLLVLAGLLVGVVSNAASASQWGPGQPLAPVIDSDRDGFVGVAGAVFPDGSRLAAWDRGGVKVAFGTPAGTFAAPKRLGVDTGSILQDDLAIDPAGDAVLTWANHVAVRRAGHPFGPVQQLTYNAGKPTMDRTGNTIISGPHNNFGGLIVYTKPARASRFGHPQFLAPRSVRGFFTRKVMLRGGALVAFVNCRRHTRPGTCLPELSIAVAGRSLVFGHLQHLGSLQQPFLDRDLPGFAVAPLPGGGAVVVWGTDEHRPRVMEGIVAPHSTRVDHIRTISSHAVAAVSPDLAVDRNGAGLAVWEERRNRHSRVVSATVAPNGRIATPRRLSPLGSDAAAPGVLVNGAGATLVHWITSGEKAHVISHLAGAPFGPVGTLAGDGFAAEESFTLDDAGDALATWRSDARSPQDDARLQAVALWHLDARPSPILFPPRAITGLTSSGRAFAITYRDPGDGSDLHLEAAVREPGQPFGPLQDIGTGIPLVLATNASGAALVLGELGSNEVQAGKRLTAFSSG